MEGHEGGVMSAGKIADVKRFVADADLVFSGALDPRLFFLRWPDVSMADGAAVREVWYLVGYFDNDNEMIKEGGSRLAYYKSEYAHLRAFIQLPPELWGG